MTKTKYTERLIKLSNLLLNPENYRFSPQTTQYEAINAMLSGQGDKLYVLAKDIVENGLNPSEYPIVSPIYGEESQELFKVLEGNRRIAALKLLSVPEMIDAKRYASLRKKFQKLSQIYIENPIRSIKCVVFEDECEADLWIERKHALGQGGAGIEYWNSVMRQRFDEATKGKKTPTLQIIDLLQSFTELSESDSQLLENINTTNLNRLISDPYVRNVIGLERHNGELFSKRSKADLANILLDIVRDISRSDFRVADIYNKALRETYIDNLYKNKGWSATFEEEKWGLRNENPDVEKKLKSNSNDKKISEKTKVYRERTTLIPKDFELPITKEHPRIYDVFKELQKLSAKQYPNSVAVMFRVFLEFSVNAYLETFCLLKEGALTANDAGTKNLSGNINKVLNHLDNSNVINRDFRKGIRSELDSQSSPLSVDSLNSYIHSHYFYPKYLGLLTSWDNVQPFFLILWRQIENQLSKVKK